MSSRQTKVTLAPEVLRWARERASLSHEELAGKVQVKPETVGAWEISGEISFAQIDRLAARTYTPLGFLFLSKPPEEKLPMADFRTRTGSTPRRPSPDLLDTAYHMKERQAWMRDELIEWGVEPIKGMGAYNLNSDRNEVAEAIGDLLKIQGGWAEIEVSLKDALEHLRDRVDAAGILVVFNGVVGNDTHRKLNPDEFQGFALFDEYAPLVFVNAADFKAAQIFTLVHELAHLFIGESGLSGFVDLRPGEYEVEKFCNEVAAEFLVPQKELVKFWETAHSKKDPYQAVARHFKVSIIVAARRAVDLGLADSSAFAQVFSAYKKNKDEVLSRQKGGGDFWNLPQWRIGKEFASAVVRATKEGRLPYREAYDLTEIRGDSFDDLVDVLNIQL